MKKLKKNRSKFLILTLVSTMFLIGGCTSNPSHPIENIKYGDVNEDEIIDGNDTSLLVKYLSDNTKYELSDGGLKKADVNKDGKVDNTDLDILLKYVHGWDIELPYTNKYEIKTVWGDANEDGKLNGKDVTIILQVIQGMEGKTVTEQGRINGDVNCDGKMNEFDSKILFYYAAGWDITLPYNTIIGDVNDDGVVDGKDSTALQKYLSDSQNNPLNTKGVINADVNCDNKVDNTDLDILLNYLSENYDELPYVEE